MKQYKIFANYLTKKIDHTLYCPHGSVPPQIKEMHNPFIRFTSLYKEITPNLFVTSTDRLHLPRIQKLPFMNTLFITGLSILHGGKRYISIILSIHNNYLSRFIRKHQEIFLLVGKFNETNLLLSPI